MVRPASTAIVFFTLAAGCAHPRRTPEEPQTAPVAAKDDVRAADESASEAIVVDEDTQVIDFAGAEEDAGPAPVVVAPPKRPNMPSMMPGVVTGPTGHAPGG